MNEILRIGLQTAEGLAAAHAQGLVHRDVKPANILLENSVERVKNHGPSAWRRRSTTCSLTQAGLIAGTPAYMSPEQAEGKHVDQRSDLFSLGSVLYVLCTGESPFRAGTTMAVLKRIRHEKPRPLREIKPEIPAWLEAVIDRLHAKASVRSLPDCRRSCQPARSPSGRATAAGRGQGTFGAAFVQQGDPLALPDHAFYRVVAIFAHPGRPRRAGRANRRVSIPSSAARFHGRSLDVGQRDDEGSTSGVDTSTATIAGGTSRSLSPASMP